MLYAAFAALLLSPVIWVAFASLSPERTLFSERPWANLSLDFSHYRSLFEQRKFWIPLRNSLLVATSTTLACVSLGSLCAYALARLEYRARGLVTAFLVAISAFPQISVVEPLYALLRELGLINTYAGLVLAYITFALPLTVLLLISYFKQLPREIENAARLDGAGAFQIFRHVVLPLSVPGLVATAIISFVYCWNEFLFALSFTAGHEHQTLPVAIAMLRGRHQIPWGELFAASMVTALPVALLVLVFQRRILQGLTSSGQDD